MMQIISIGLGGAVGAIGRYLISLVPTKSAFPFLTLLINVCGAILIGFIVGISSNSPSYSENKLLFWKVGVCGGFTTFSTFSFEALLLLENRKYLFGGIYIVLSVTLCILGVWLGRYFARVWTLK